MTSKPQLPIPVLCYEGKLRNWWRFGDGDQALAVTEGPSSRGHTFRCDCSPTTHTCIHIKALERHIGVQDYRNQPARTREDS